MTVAGITINDADSLEAAADLLDGVEEVTCPECDGRRTIEDYDGWDWRPMTCPCCGGDGTILDIDPDFDPEPPTPAAPALAVVIPLFACETCRDTGRVDKPSTWFAGKTVEGFCPDCTPHYDFARRGFVNCGANASQPGEAPQPSVSAPTAEAPRPFDRAAHCQRIGEMGGRKTLERHGRAHFVAIGKAGYQATVKAHGVAYVNGILDAKRWHGPRRPDLLTDLVAGRVLADLDRAA